jgi:hypothetical protein
MHIAEPFAPIFARRVNQVIIHANAGLRRSRYSLESAKEEEVEPRRRVVSNGDVKFEIVEPIAPIDLIAPLMHAVQRRSSLIFQGVCVCVSDLRLRLGYCKCMGYQSLVPSR